MHRHKTGLLGGGNHLPVPQSFVMLASWMEQGLTFIPQPVFQHKRTMARTGHMP